MQKPGKPSDERHINLFADFHGVARPDANPEREAEMREEKQRQDRSEAAFLDSAKKPRTQNWLQSKIPQGPKERRARDTARKDALDPLHIMRKGEGPPALVACSIIRL